MFANLITELQMRGYEAEEVTINKNGVPNHGIIVNVGSNIMPTVYPTEETTVEQIIEQVEKAPVPEIDAISICNWEYVKDKLVACVCSQDKEDLPHVRKLDLDVYARVVLDLFPEEAGMTSAKVTGSLLKAWGKTIDEVLEVATENSFKDLHIKHMVEVLKEMLPEDYPEELLPTELDYPMYVISNTGKCNGSIQMFNPEVFSRLSEKLGNDFVILPSSVHEVIAVPYVEETDFSAMVREINATQVAEVDRLSDTIYRFKDGELAIA